MWFYKEEDYSAEAVERVIQHLKWFRFPIVVTCSGNKGGITHRFTVSESETLTLTNLLRGSFPKAHVEQESQGNDLRAEMHTVREGALAYRSLSPPRPYWGVFHGCGSEMGSVYSTMMGLGGDELGIYQVVFVPLSRQWSSIARTMLQAEAMASERIWAYRDWVLSEETFKKGQEKLAYPLFAAAVRVGCVARATDRVRALVDSLLLAIAGVHFSGGAVETISEDDLARRGVESDAITESFLDGTTFQTGLILCPAELALFLRLPPAEILQDHQFSLDRTPTLVADLAEEEGVLLGIETVFGRDRPVIWPNEYRARHMLVSGTTGFGKTMFIAVMAARMINGNTREGIAIIDPHDKAIEEFVCRIDDEQLDRCVLFEAAESEYVLGLPLVDCTDLNQVDTAVSNISRQFISLFSKSDMGFNIERGMRCGIRTVLLCSDLCLLDVRHLFSRTRKGEECREKACRQIADDMLIEYWENDLPSLDNGTLGRIRSRFEHIFEPVRLRPFLGNRIRKISYREIIDQGLIFLVRTSPGPAGGDMASILGTLHLTGLEAASHSRDGDEGQRPIFTIVADEFGNYSNPRTMPHGLRTLRRSDVSVVLATQNVDALPQEVINALGNINTHIVFQQGWEDAHRYFKTFCGMVPAEEFLVKSPGEGYGKVGSRFAALTCPLPERVRDPGVLGEIRANTRRKYGIPMKEFRERMIDEKHVSFEEMKDLDLI